MRAPPAVQSASSPWCEQITFNAAAFAPQALPPSLKLRRTAVALAEAGRRASPKLGNRAERRRETAEVAEKKCARMSQRALRALSSNVAVFHGLSTASAQSNTPLDTSRPPFAEWLADVRAEALSRGIHPDVVDQALNQLSEPLPVVIERDRAQAESVLSLEQYLRRRLTPKMTTRGREMFARHQTMLEEVGSRYGVSPRIIVSVWGLESNFGGFSGVRPTIAALATLAWDQRRAEFFRRELFDALEILNRGDIELSRMRGSWAGAMGQPQFMPSSYLKFAEDFDGDGRRDIWSSPPDVFASIANFLKGHGWTAGERWGREVKVSEDAARRIAAEVAKRQGTCGAARDMTVALPMKRWQQLGVRLPTGAPLPASHEDAGEAARVNDTAALVSGATRHFLVNGNYDALLNYNCAHSYAISVGLLADRIEGAPGARTETPKRRTARRARRE